MKYRELTHDEANIFLSIGQASEEQINKMYDGLKAQPGGWVLEAISKRFTAYKLNVAKSVQIMVLTIGNGTVGYCAQIVDDITSIYKEKNLVNANTKEITLDYYSKNIHPLGVPDIS